MELASENQRPHLISARRLSEGLRVGNLEGLGYACELCQEPLQVTRRAADLLAGKPRPMLLCNACSITALALRHGATTVELGADAKKQLAHNPALAERLAKTLEAVKLTDFAELVKSSSGY